MPAVTEPKDVTEQIRAQLLKARDAGELTGNEIAAALGVKPGAVSMMLHGKRGIHPRYYPAIKRLLKREDFGDLVESSDLPGHSPLIQARKRFNDAKAEADRLRHEYNELLTKARECNAAMWELLNHQYTLKSDPAVPLTDHGQRTAHPARRRRSGR